MLRSLAIEFPKYIISAVDIFMLVSEAEKKGERT